MGANSTMNRSKKQQTAPQIAKLRRKAFPPMEKNAKPSQIVPNSILCSSPSHTRGVNSLSPRSSRPLLSHRFSAHPPAQQLSPHKGLAEATQAEKTKEKRRDKKNGRSMWKNQQKQKNRKLTKKSRRKREKGTRTDETWMKAEKDGRRNGLLGEMLIRFGPK